jgi:LysR family transcriptional regulator, regulator for bpeEF and oprC
MDRFDAMRAYVQVVECGSFTKAAQALARHKATVSQQVQQLEDKLAARLLTRTTRSVVPTAEGLAYYQRACAILQQVDEAEALLARGRGSPGGRLRVAVPVAMGRMLLVPEIGAFLARYPRISLELGCTDRNVDLVKEGVDCALRGGELADSTLVRRSVGELPFVLCAAPDYIDAHGLPGQPEDLAAHQRVGYRSASKGELLDLRLTRAGQMRSVSMPSRLITDDSGVVLSAGLDGLGIIHVAEFVARHHLASGALLRVLPGWHCPSLPLHLVTPNARQRTARVLAFMAWAQELLQRRLGIGIGAAAEAQR